MGRFSFKMPSFTLPTSFQPQSDVFVPPPLIEDMNFGNLNMPEINPNIVPNIPQINVPDASNPMNLLSTGLQKASENIEHVVQGVVDPVMDTLKGDNYKLDDESSGPPGSAPPPTLLTSAGETNLATSEGSDRGGYGKKRKGEVSRGQMNLTSGRTSSLLTS